MNILDFTAEETALIAIYAEDCVIRAKVIARITDALPDMDNEMRGIAASSAAKLAIMTDDDFDRAVFALADNTDDIA